MIEQFEGAMWFLAEEVLSVLVDSDFVGQLPTHDEIIEKAVESYKDGLELRSTHLDGTCSCLKSAVS